jgi:hypothetical protein
MLRISWTLTRGAQCAPPAGNRSSRRSPFGNRWAMILPVRQDESGPRAPTRAADAASHELLEQRIAKRVAALASEDEVAGRGLEDDRGVVALRACADPLPDHAALGSIAHRLARVLRI